NFTPGGLTKAACTDERQCSTAREKRQLVVRGAVTAGDERTPAFADSLAACLQAPEPADCPYERAFRPLARHTPAQSPTARVGFLPASLRMRWCSNHEDVSMSAESEQLS